MGWINSVLRPRIRTKPSLPVLQVGNLQGIGRRERQEDSFAVYNNIGPNQNGLLAIIADGMGGLADGRAASELTIERFLQRFQKLDDSRSIPAHMKKTAQEISGIIHQEFSGNSGSTLVAAYISQGAVHWLSVGDSAIFLMRNGGVFQLNQEHTFLNKMYMEELEKPVMDCAGVESHEDASRLTAFIGIEPLEKTEVSFQPLQLADGDALLLCSDGISSVLSSPELMEAMRLNPEDGCKLLDLLIQEKGIVEQDNYTGIMISYRNRK